MRRVVLEEFEKQRPPKGNFRHVAAQRWKAVEAILDSIEDTLSGASPFMVAGQPALEKAKEYLEIANADLSAAILLSHSRDYATATYHLQQCHEKAAKSFLIAVGARDPDHMNESSHNTLAELLRLLKSRVGEDILFLEKALEYGDQPRRLAKANQLISSMPFEKLRGWTYKEYVRLCNALRTMRSLDSNLATTEVRVRGLLAGVLPEWSEQINSVSGSSRGRTRLQLFTCSVR